MVAGEAYEDSFAVDPSSGVAAVADGVASAMFSRQWADILTEATIEAPPDSTTDGAFGDWLQDHRQKWLEQIDLPNLKWNERSKLQQAGGAFSTLIWLQLFERETTDAGETPELDGVGFAYRCSCIGDCNLFHIRGSNLELSFPMNVAADFDLHPSAICSFKQGDDSNGLTTMEGACEAGDLLLLASDAIAQHLLARVEAEDPPHWKGYWTVEMSQWLAEIDQLRKARSLHRDDTTMLLLEVGQTAGVSAGEADDAGDQVARETSFDEPQSIRLQEAGLYAAACQAESTIFEDDTSQVSEGESVEDEAAVTTQDMGELEDVSQNATDPTVASTDDDEAEDLDAIEVETDGANVVEDDADAPEAGDTEDPAVEQVAGVEAGADAAQAGEVLAGDLAPDGQADGAEAHHQSEEPVSESASPDELESGTMIEEPETANVSTDVPPASDGSESSEAETEKTKDV